MMLSKSIPRLLPVLFLTVLLAGCAGSAGSNQNAAAGACIYKERDLTLPWAGRTYWCKPATPTQVSQKERRAG